MNPSGQPNPGQNNFPPNQPSQPGSPYPPTSNPYNTQPTSYPQQVPQPQPWNTAPQQQPGVPSANYGPAPAAPATYTADYLDQIAPPPAGPKLMGGNFMWILIGLAVVFMFAVGLLTLTSGGNNTATAQSVYLRVENLGTVSDNYRRYLKSTKLTTANTNLKIFLSNARRDITDPLVQNGVDLAKISKETKDKEVAAADEITAKLEDARLNAILDRTYAREMAYQTQLLIEQYNKMAKNPSPLIADNAKKTIPNLEPLQKTFAEFNEADD